MMNNVTDKAKKFPQQVKRQLEAYGGKILMGVAEA